MVSGLAPQFLKTKIRDSHFQAHKKIILLHVSINQHIAFVAYDISLKTVYSTWAIMDYFT